MTKEEIKSNIEKIEQFDMIISKPSTVVSFRNNDVVMKLSELDTETAETIRKRLDNYLEERRNYFVRLLNTIDK